MVQGFSILLEVVGSCLLGVVVHEGLFGVLLRSFEAFCLPTVHGHACRSPWWPGPPTGPCQPPWWPWPPPPAPPRCSTASPGGAAPASSTIEKPAGFQAPARLAHGGFGAKPTPFFPPPFFPPPFIPPPLLPPPILPPPILPPPFVPFPCWLMAQLRWICINVVSPGAFSSLRHRCDSLRLGESADPKPKERSGLQPNSDGLQPIVVSCY